MSHAKHALIAAVLGAGLLAIAGTAGADTILEQSNVAYNGKVLRVEDKGLILKWDLTKNEKAFPLNRIKRLTVDGQTSLNKAEGLFGDGNYKDAVSNYEAAKLRASQDWLKQYINARLVTCFGQAGQFSRAVKTFIELAQAGSPLLAWVQLPSVAPKGSPENEQALRVVEGALATSPNMPGHDRLEELRLNIKLVSGDPQQLLPEIERQLDGPNPEHRAKMRLKHVELLLELGRLDDARKSLDVARTGVEGKYGPLDVAFEPELLFYEGRYLYARKDYLHAALKFMRVPIHYSMTKKDLAAECLVWAARAMKDSGKVPLSEVASPLQWAVSKFDGTGGAAKAQKMLADLQAGK